MPKILVQKIKQISIISPRHCNIKNSLLEISMNIHKYFPERIFL